MYNWRICARNAQVVMGAKTRAHELARISRSREQRSISVIPSRHWLATPVSPDSVKLYLDDDPADFSQNLRNKELCKCNRIWNAAGDFWTFKATPKNSWVPHLINCVERIHRPVSGSWSEVYKMPLISRSLWKRKIKLEVSKSA